MSEADVQAGGGEVHHLAAAAALSSLDAALQAVINQCCPSLASDE